MKTTVLLDTTLTTRGCYCRLPGPFQWADSGVAGGQVREAGHGPQDDQPGQFQAGAADGPH